MNHVPRLWLPSLAAIACLLGSPLAAAGTGPTLYGLLDIGVVRETGGMAGPRTAVTSGIGAQSRIGLRGSEPITDGMELLYVLESGIAIDTGALTPPGNLLFGREASLSLRSPAGTVAAGRFMTPFYKVLSASDPFETGMAGSAGNLLATSGIRMSNALRYTAPSVAGVVVELVAASGEGGTGRAGDAYGGSLAYVQPAFAVRLAHHARYIDTSGRERSTNTIIGVTYTTMLAKVFAAAVRNRGAGSAPLALANPYGYALLPRATPASMDYLVGLALPLGSGKIDLSYTRKNDQTARNDDAAQLALGYVHTLSPRLSFYGAVAAIRNRNLASYTVGNQSGEPGSGDRAWNLGVRHLF